MRRRSAVELAEKIEPLHVLHMLLHGLRSGGGIVVGNGVGDAYVLRVADVDRFGDVFSRC